MCGRYPSGSPDFENPMRPPLTHPLRTMLLRSWPVSVLVFALSVCPNAYAQQPITSPGWVKTASGCEVWAYPMPPFKSVYVWGVPFRVSWSGDCADGRASGEGVLESEDPKGKTHYEGGMRAGKMHGQGTATLPDGQTISGVFNDGIVEGQVIYTSSNGMHYEGRWSNGAPEGEGTATWPSGIIYSGNWHGGKESGVGTMKDPSTNTTYQGEFLEGKRNGHGTVIYSNGSTATVEWKAGVPNGHGEFTSTLGDHFEGEFRDGKMNGHGIMLSHTGARYEGEWRDGFPDGEGTLVRPDTAQFSGQWRHGCFQDGDRRTTFRVEPSSCP